MLRRQLLVFVALAASSLPALAQPNYPNRRIELVVPYAAGSATDGIARILADGLSKQISQPVITLNKPGANGMIAARYVQTTPSDGYTVLITANGIVIEQVLKKDANFDIRTDLIPVVRAIQATQGFFVAPSLPASNIDEFVAYAKKNPGKVNYATAGVGSIAHLNTEAFRLAAGIDIVHVPYPGGTGAVIPALLTGDVHMYIVEAGSMRGQVEDGRIKILATLNQERSPIFPNTPAISEAANPALRNVFNPVFFGMFVAPKTEPGIVAQLADHINAVLADKETQRRLAPLGYDAKAIGGTTTEQFKKVVFDELSHVQKVVKEAKIPQQ